VVFLLTTWSVKAEAANFPLEILYFLEIQIFTIFNWWSSRCCHFRDNLLVEKGSVLSSWKNGFSKCKVSVAVPKTFEYNSIEDLNGKIATSYQTQF
jgi:ATP phosphoribosyltransferase